MASDLNHDPARMDDIAVDRLVERIKREAARHVDTHKDGLRAEALAEAAADLRARAEAIHSSHGEVPDPLADAIWKACHRDEVAGAVYADPRTIARAAYLAVADLLGQDRTDPDVIEHARTETTPHD